MFLFFCRSGHDRYGYGGKNVGTKPVVVATMLLGLHGEWMFVDEEAIEKVLWLYRLANKIDTYTHQGWENECYFLILLFMKCFVCLFCFWICSWVVILWNPKGSQFIRNMNLVWKAWCYYQSNILETSSRENFSMMIHSKKEKKRKQFKIRLSMSHIAHTTCSLQMNNFFSPFY